LQHLDLTSQGSTSDVSAANLIMPPTWIAVVVSYAHSSGARGPFRGFWGPFMSCLGSVRR
jgi:hypothetical protein